MICFINPEGRVIFSLGIDAVLPANFACWHWNLVQVADNRWDFQYVADESAPEGMERPIAAVLGQGMRVNRFRQKFIQTTSRGKLSLLKPLTR